jgi:hypothetical protein
MGWQLAGWRRENVRFHSHNAHLLARRAGTINSSSIPTDRSARLTLVLLAKCT